MRGFIWKLLMSIFSGIQNTAFDIVTNVFGNDASWLPKAGGPLQTATVLYKDATEKHGLGDVDYNIERYVMEYKAGVFPGLKESVTAGEMEKVSITTDQNITLEFFVRRIETKFDGKTIIAILNPPQ